MCKRTSYFLILFFAVIQSFFFLLLSFGQGNLTPPGTPASSMHTLQEIYNEAAAMKAGADAAAGNAAAAKDARTPIRASDVPLTITSPGSYYLTESVTVSTTDTHGITIDCDNVTIDLNGFTLSGPGVINERSISHLDSDVMMPRSNAPILSYLAGIYVVYSDDPRIEHYNITIKNGVLTNWYYGAVGGVSNNTFESLRCYNNHAFGLWVGSNSIVNDNVCLNNGMSGIQGIDGCVVSGNSVKGQRMWGISVQKNCTVTGNVCSSNGDDGMTLYSGVVKGNVCCENGGVGINVGNGRTVVSENVCLLNTESGIDAHGSCLVVNNVCNFNRADTLDAAGIRTSNQYSSIEGNLVVRNNTGIDATSYTSYNGIISNRASGNDTDYNIGANNTTFTGDRENVSF